jgi:hypothetical protein
VPAVLCLALASCGGGGGGAGNGPPQLRVVDAVYDASSNYDVLVNSASAVTDMAYGQATTFQAAQSGSNSVVFEPTGTTVTVLTASFSATTGYNDTVLALEGQSALAAVIVAQDNGAVSSGQSRLSLVHACPQEASLDFYLTGPTDDLPASPSVPALTYTASASSALAPAVLTVSSGDYRLRAVATGDTTQTVVYDSGTITLESGVDLLAAVVQTSGSAAPFSLMALDASSNVSQIADQRVQLRMGNFAPALGSVDTFLDTSGTSDSSATLFAPGLDNGNVSGYQAVLPGSYRGSMAAAGSTQEIVGAPLALSPSTSVSVFAIGFSGQTGAAALQLLTLLDDLTTPASGMAKLRVVLASPDVGTLSSSGTVDVVALDTSGSSPVISRRLVVNLAYAGASTYLSLAAGSYTIALVPAGVDTPLLPSSSGVPVSLAAGTVNTIVVDGCEYPGSGVCASGANSLTLVPLDDTM